MPASYSCGVCGKDVTARVLAACTRPPTRVILEAAPAERMVRVWCDDQHLCDFACDAPDGTTVRGIPVEPAAAAQWKTWLDYAAPAASLVRISTYARWILTGNTLVIILAGALTTIGITRLDRPAAQVTYALSVVLLGASMVAASFALAPASVDVGVDRPVEVAEAYRNVLRRRSRIITVASAFFGLALAIAALVPLAQVYRRAAPPLGAAGLAFSVSDTGTITAKLTAPGADAPLEVALLSRVGDSAEVTRVLDRAVAGASGTTEASIRAGGIRSRQPALVRYWLVGRWRWDSAKQRFTDSIRLPVPTLAQPDPAAPADSARSPKR
jgi:hypothetical protein